jgi:hypothetical protein
VSDAKIMELLPLFEARRALEFHAAMHNIGV